ncbi:hypothetical protein [Desulfocurvibacter africanus]|uniref:hypothetical protein n=1 Tax=Desulfocurvibacter africanus TaxID=873 RepID=UPI00040C5FB6|nr:hypothetical protein [Desulfocurvibacter africanus]
MSDENKQAGEPAGNGEPTGNGEPATQENQELKAMQDALSSVLEDLKADIPENMRELIPGGLPPAEQIKWIRQAQKKGLFAKPAANSPDSKQPSGKKPADLDGMTPHQMLAMGYGN